jgi:predicted N-acetyltransferase YhbS
MHISFSAEKQLNEEEFTALLHSCSLGKRRPLHQPERIKAMCENANLVVTARLNGKLVGVARSLSDFSYCTYLSDLAVSEEVQKLGIGRELIRRTREAAPEATLILLSAPAAEHYYPKLGMQKHEAAFILKAGEELK